MVESDTSASMPPGGQGGVGATPMAAAPDLARRLRFWLLTAATTAVLCLAYLVVRGCQAIDFAEPPLVWTTGCEEEALFSLWRLVHGEAVYADVFRIPFAGSYFNWLFYQVNGVVLRLALPWLGDASGQIPNLARLAALGFQLAAVPVWVALGREAGCLPRSWRWQAAALAVCALFPLAFSLWTITCRPDTGALCFELAGALWAVRYLRDRRLSALLLCLLLFFGAWSFRQTNVSGVTALCLCLILRREWRGLALAVVLMLAAYGVAFAIGGCDYLYAICLAQRHMGLSLTVGIHNALAAALKAPLFGAALVLLPGALRALDPRPWQPEAERYVPVLFCVSLLVAGLTGMKNGAYVNYFLPPAAVGALMVVGRVRQADRWALVPLAGSAALLGAQSLAIVATLTGVRHTVGLRAGHDRAVLLRQALAECPAPVLVSRPSHNLPWVQPHAPHFVVAAAYDSDRQAGGRFEGGGLDGLLEQGYFGTVAVDTRVAPKPDIDLRQLARHYRLERQVGGFDLYLRQP